MSRLYENDEIRKEAERLIRDETDGRVNQLADFALSGKAYGLHEDFETFQEAMTMLDYDQAALDWLDELKGDKDELAEYLENSEMTEQELDTWVFEDSEQVCQDEDLDPDIIEIYEFWSVSLWLARHLAEQGHATADLLDFKVWGRPTTGQTASMDYVILKIAESIVEGRKNG